MKKVALCSMAVAIVAGFVYFGYHFLDADEINESLLSKMENGGALLPNQRNAAQASSKTRLVRESASDTLTISSVEATEWKPDLNRPAGLSLVSLNIASLPLELRQQYQSDLTNLKTKGSFSGGVQTSEFSLEADLKKEFKQAGYDENRLYKALNFNSVRPHTLISGLQLIGAMPQGTLVENKGYSGVFYIYNVQSDEGIDSKKLEVSESFLHGDTAIQAYTEFINYYVEGLPATLERLKSAKGEPIVNIHWTTDKRDFSISTFNLPLEQAQAMAARLTQQAQLLDAQIK